VPGQGDETARLHHASSFKQGKAACSAQPHAMLNCTPHCLSHPNQHSLYKVAVKILHSAGAIINVLDLHTIPAPGGEQRHTDIVQGKFRGVLDEPSAALSDSIS
jgi:hypothetical protein